jgi:hypothetical protein
MKTIQELFDTACSALIKQGAPSIDTSEALPAYARCMYRAPDGKRCAVGHLISDENPYLTELTQKNPGIGSTFSFVGSALTHEQIPVDGLTIAFLIELQFAHDNNKNARNFVAMFKLAASQLAKKFDLDASVLDK